MKNIKNQHPLPLNQIRIHDVFWQKHLDLVKKEIIPYQWAAINDQVPDAEPSHSMENFRIAAGLSEGEFHGVVFQDTDVAKWLEAVAYSLSCRPDPELEATADEVIGVIGRAQCPDGYINTYFTLKEPEGRWTNLMEGHELYTAGHLMEAAVAYYQATGKRAFLDIMCRFADYICETFGPNEDQIHGYPGHQEIELALVKLYQVTGIRRYLEEARYFIDIRGAAPNYFLEERKKPGFKQIFTEFKNYRPDYSQSHLPVREQTAADGHAVRAVYMYCAMADLAAEYQDQELLDSCIRLWNNMVEKRMYITGGIGSSGISERFTTDYDLPNANNYSETCASIGLALFGLRMARLQNDAGYIDIVERALYNTILDGIALDGKSFFYVNPLEVWPDNCMEGTSMGHVKPVRQKWFGVACCPPNVARTLASLGQYIYSADSDSLYLNLFISNEADAVVGDAALKIRVKTRFPFEGQVKIHVQADAPAEKTIAVRIPDYAREAKLKVNGQAVSLSAEKGFVRLRRVWSDDTLELTFSIPPRFVRANPNVREDAGKVCIMKGPLVYALEETDNGSRLASLYVDTRAPLLEHFEPELFGGVAVIEAEGLKISEKGWEDNRLYAENEPVLEPVTLKAIPYAYWGNRTPGEMLVWMKEKL